MDIKNKKEDRLIMILKKRDSLDEGTEKLELFKRCYLLPNEEYFEEVKKILLDMNYSRFDLKNSEILTIEANENTPYKKAREIIEFNRYIVNGTPEVYGRTNRGYDGLFFSPKIEWDEKNKEIDSFIKGNKFITCWEDKKAKKKRILLVGGYFWDDSFYYKEGLSESTLKVLSIGNKRGRYQYRSFWERI